MPRASGMDNMSGKYRRRTPKYGNPKKIFVTFVSFVDSLSKTKLWETAKTIAALIVLLALLAFSCWLNIYWCFGWC